MSTAEVFQWTAERFELAAEAGLFGDDRVELLDGEVLVLAPMRPPHAATVRSLAYLLIPALAAQDVTVGVEGPVRLDERTEPLPDVWIARGRPSRYDDRHPSASELLLAVEVSDTTLGRDLRRKLPAYAAAGIPVVWVVALGVGEVLEHRDPDVDLSLYRSVHAAGRGATLNVPGTDLSVAVDDLLR